MTVFRGGSGKSFAGPHYGEFIRVVGARRIRMRDLGGFKGKAPNLLLGFPNNASSGTYQVPKISPGHAMPL